MLSLTRGMHSPLPFLLPLFLLLAGCSSTPPPDETTTNHAELVSLRLQSGSAAFLVSSETEATLRIRGPDVPGSWMVGATVIGQGQSLHARLSGYSEARIAGSHVALPATPVYEDVDAELRIPSGTQTIVLHVAGTAASFETDVPLVAESLRLTEEPQLLSSWDSAQWDHADPEAYSPFAGFFHATAATGGTSCFDHRATAFADVYNISLGDMSTSGEGHGRLSTYFYGEVIFSAELLSAYGPPLAFVYSVPVPPAAAELVPSCL